MSRSIALLALGISMAAIGGCGGDGGSGFGDCAKLAAGFQACGGEVQGSWELTQVCPQIAEHPFGEDCPTATGTGTVDITMTMAIGATNIDFGAMTINVAADYTIPETCLAAFGASDCAGMADSLASDEDNHATCTDAGEACQCHFTSTGSEEAGTETYRIEGTNLILDEAGTPETAAFCVKGSELALKFADSHDFEYMVLKKK